MVKMMILGVVTGVALLALLACFACLLACLLCLLFTIFAPVKMKIYFFSAPTPRRLVMMVPTPSIS